MKELFNSIKEIIENFNKKIVEMMPKLEANVELIILNKSQNKNKIEHLLDTLLNIGLHGFGKKSFIKLLEYYKTIDSDGADFYWHQYDKQGED